MRLMRRHPSRPAEVTHVALITRSVTDWRAYDMTGRQRPAAPPAVNLPFPVGSVSKLVTALAIHRLCERGELHIDQHVNGVRGSPGQRAPDLRDLLAHSSGLPPWQGLAEQFRAHSGPGVQWCYSAANYIAAARHAALRLGMPFDSTVAEVIADPCGAEFLGRARRREGVPGLEFPGGSIPPLRVSVPCPTGDTWFAHGMMTSWGDLLAFLRELLHGGEFYREAESLRQPYTSGLVPNPFQSAGARILLCGGARWAMHGGNWPGHRVLVAFSRESAVAAYSCYRDRTPRIRNIARSVIAEATAAEQTEVARAGGEVISEALSPAGAATLSLGARWTIGSPVRLTCGPGIGSLAGKKEYPLAAVPGTPNMWQYRAWNEDRLLHVTRVRGTLRVLLERPACILRSRQ